MAKRELIDKKKLIRDVKESNAIDFAERMKFSNVVEHQKPITEEEIVKPYLNKIAVKLGELIAENMENDNGLPIPNQYAYCYQEVLEFVGNLLTEKGAEE